MNLLLVTVRFLDDRYHGLLDRGGPPEWPPSPFRLFCAMVAGVARCGDLEGDTGKALAWLQTLAPPIIIAPKAKTGRAITRFVPNNDADKKPDRQERLTAKPTIPTLMMLGRDEKPEVHYLWNVDGRPDVPWDRVRDAARSVTALGWGIDMAVADATCATDADVQKLPGVRWPPKPGASRNYGMLRVPTADAETQEDTLGDLKRCHQSAVERIEHGQPLHTVEKPRVFERVFYASAARPLGPPFHVFELQDADGELDRYPQRSLIHIAGMVRHLAIEKMTKDPPRGIESDWVETYIAGHRRGAGRVPKNDDCRGAADEHRQLSYVPLPSIGHPYVDPAVRRVMLVAPVGDEGWLEHVAERLAGLTLKPRRDEFGEDDPPRLVSAKDDDFARFYTRPANIWASVTPVILPGHDDHKPAKRHKLIEKALAQSGIDQPCEFESSAISRFPKSLPAYKYDRQKRPIGYFRPDHLQGQTAVHLTLRFADGLKVPGPIAIGAGRHCGFGTFAAER